MRERQSRTSDHIGLIRVACDNCFMFDAVESEVMSEKCPPVLGQHKLHGDRWVTERVVPRNCPDTHAGKATAEGFGHSRWYKFVHTLGKRPCRVTACGVCSCHLGVSKHLKNVGPCLPLQPPNKVAAHASNPNLRHRVRCAVP